MMRIFRKKIHPDDLAALSTRDIARCCGVSERTARMWKEKGPTPAAARLLALAVGDLEAIAGKRWRFWYLDSVGNLYAPDGHVWDAGQLEQWWIEQQMLSTLKQEIARYQAGVPIIDRGELDRLQQARDVALRLSAELTALYPPIKGTDAADAAAVTRSSLAVGYR
ncbi:MAG: DUF3653 domain-containing protein [Salinisphaera sp.]|nr:DUF3653 domain-containing protein [Salinisphaera sp.]